MTQKDCSNISMRYQPLILNFVGLISKRSCLKGKETCKLFCGLILAVRHVISTYLYLSVSCKFGGFGRKFPVYDLVPYNLMITN